MNDFMPDRGATTPEFLLIVAATILLQRRLDSGAGLPDVPGETGSDGFDPNSFEAVAQALQGEVQFAREMQWGGLVSMKNVVGFLAALVDDENLDAAEIDRMLELAVEVAGEVSHAEGPSLLTARGIDVGPWDFRENGWKSTQVIDFGGLLIPREDDLDIELTQSRTTGELLQVAVSRGSTSLQLQAYHSYQAGAWASACEQLASQALDMGGMAREWTGPYGLELRCELEVEFDTGDRGMHAVCYFGCEGPGWLLRATVSGGLAFGERPPDWIYSYFGGVVVAPATSLAAAPASPVAFGSLRPDLQGRPIVLRQSG